MIGVGSQVKDSYHCCYLKTAASLREITSSQETVTLDMLDFNSHILTYDMKDIIS